MPPKLSLPSLFLLSLACWPAAAQQAPRIEKTADGVVLHLAPLTDQDTRTVRLTVVSDHIIHVQASPLDTLSTTKSLMVVPQTGPAGRWNYREKKGVGRLTTPALTATIALATGAVSFSDAQGRPLLQERAGGGKVFRPTVADGQPLYEVTQVFASPLDEGLYGLGQHQNGVMNYRGHCALRPRAAVRRREARRPNHALRVHGPGRQILAL